MFSKGGTKWLMIIVVGLAVIYALSQLFGTSAKERSFRKVVMTLDTSAVASVKINSAMDQDGPYVLRLTNGEWMVGRSDGPEYPAAADKVEPFIDAFAELRTKRFAGTGDKIKEKYQLTDSLADRITFELASGERAIIDIGTVSGGGVVGAPQQASPIMYVSMEGEDEVFSVAAAPSAAGTMDHDSWRQAHLVQGEPDTWESITFTMENDTGYTLVRSGDVWTIDSDTANTASVNSFTSALSNAQVPRFAPVGLDATSGTLTYRLQIQSSTGRPLDLKVYRLNGRLFAYSDHNVGNIIEFDEQRDIPRMFRSRSIFLQ